MKKLMMLAAMLAVAMVAVAPALAQDDPAVVADATTNTAGAGVRRPRPSARTAS